MRIAHVDADCFYVSCERIRDASLVGRSVGVLGNQGACVIARSYEMKAKGVTVGMPIQMAKRLCPEGIYIKRDFEWYGIISHQIQDILHHYSNAVEFYSVDESFLDVSHARGDEQRLALEMQRVILKELRVPVSVGIGATKTLAKLGSDKHKPFGTTIITEKNREALLAETEVREIWGIGHQLEEKLKHEGVFTALEFLHLPRERVSTLLHKPGETLWYELQGLSLNPLHTEPPLRKSLSRGGQLWGVQRDPKIIYGFLMRNLERFVESLWHSALESRHFLLYLVTEKNEFLRAEYTFEDYTDNYQELLRALHTCFKTLYRRGLGYGAVHLASTQLRTPLLAQRNLFTKEDPRAALLKAAKQEVSARFGAFTLRSAATAFVPEVFADSASNYEICDIDGKICF
jgi:nucleotidyltransferase/DNA polymerase involved in DNA repair